MWEKNLLKEFLMLQVLMMILILRKKHIYNRMASCLKNIDALSVREDIGVKIIEKISGLQAVQVLDPTLLLPKAEWDKVATKRLINGSYLVCYVLGEIVQQKETILRIAKERGVSKVYYINTRNTQGCKEQLEGLNQLKGITNGICFINKICRCCFYRLISCNSIFS